MATRFPYEAEIFNPQSLRLEFSDSNGPIVLTQLGSGLTELDFSNQEILAVDVSIGIESKTTQNAAGFAFSQGVKTPRKWAIVVKTFDIETYTRIYYIQKAVQEGWNIKATLDGYLVFDLATGGMIPATSNAERGGIIEPAVLNVPNQSYERVLRALGLQRETTFTFEVLESEALELPDDDGNGSGVSITRNNSVIQVATATTIRN